MHRAISIPVLGFLFCLPSWATELLPRSGPEAEGVSSRKLREFVETRDREGDGVHSVMVVRHGKVIAEGWWTPYTAESNHVLYSLSKSFTSTAIGFAVAEGKVDICRFPPSSHSRFRTNPEHIFDTIPQRPSCCLPSFKR